ncbi:hypothetical protein PQE75_gp176 [Bacillus phage vB_BcoS-136]|uniref:Uncharacterized protein n=1 Tax=Bacillus phage vB_BcoS-136 TaxID=2419619 RepID=A0A3G3BVN6_9CAUD|nr:hypothetical protein PQE75_gp176 [Bacillus phage vB_BcoS-136]AYP68303.1 hypothetical protein vBBcoS136_00189 [Bacillus phage vB_BcoS-136]
MKNLFKKLFGKKEEVVEESKKYNFVANVYMKDRMKHEVVGYYESPKKLAQAIQNIMMHETIFHASDRDDNELIIRGENIDYVKVDPTPLTEPETEQQENTSEEGELQ